MRSGVVMSDCEFLQKHTAFLRLLCETPSTEQRQALLDTATPGQIRAISKLSLNLLHEGAGRIEEPVRKQLVKNQEFVRKLATEERPFARKRNLLANTHQRDVNGIQTGKGIFSFLLPVLGGLVKSLIGGETK